MNDDTKISVVLPVYNAVAFIDDAINSVLTQTFEQFELIIVDDASNDGSTLKLSEWKEKDQRISVITFQTNQGVSAARNIGMAQAKTSLIALIDADDRWLSTKLQVQYHYHLKNKCAFSCTAYYFAGTIISGKQQSDYQDLLLDNVVNTSTVLIDTKQIAISFTSTEKSEDYLEWLRLVKRFPVHLIQSALAERNLVAGASSNKLQMAQRRWQIYRDIEKMNFCVSVYYFVRYAFSGVRKHWRTWIN